VENQSEFNGISNISIVRYDNQSQFIDSGEANNYLNGSSEEIALNNKSKPLSFGTVCADGKNPVSDRP
jgi:hypothetical protein